MYTARNTEHRATSQVFWGEGEVKGDGEREETCIESPVYISVKQLYRVLLKQSIQESNQIRRYDVVGPTPGSRAMDVMSASQTGLR